MRPYAAYLRVYEPLSAFAGTDARHWAAYAASRDRPRRACALEAERAESLRMLVAAPPVAAPRQESGHAYVRWADGVTYLCPWQTRLRSWLALARLRSSSASLLAAAFPAGAADAAARDFASWQGSSESLRVYIQTSTWSVPTSWFVPFAPEERWLVLGGGGDPDPRGAATASATRTLVYATAMSLARQRVARALDAIRRSGSAGRGALGAPRADGEVESVGRWLEEFHPHALVELDYGGLVHLVDDDALRGDQSVAEVAAAIGALAGGQPELASAMSQRLVSRWRALAALELAS